MRLDARNLVAHWLAAKKDPARPVSTDGLVACDWMREAAKS